MHMHMHKENLIIELVKFVTSQRIFTEDMIGNDYAKCNSMM